MMQTTLRACVGALAFCAATGWGQFNRDPRIGYLYPGGGRVGETVRVIAGGQALRGVSEVYVSGEGVGASVVRFYKPVRNLNGEQRVKLQKSLKDLAELRWTELHEAGAVQSAKPVWPYVFNIWWGDVATTTTFEDIKLPDHPLFENLEEKSIRELAAVRDAFFNRRKNQLNTQIAGMALVEIAIDADAEIGPRELRLRTPNGLTNPMVFQVGALPETREVEPNDPIVWDPVPKEPAVDLPILVNGQIKPGDVDRIRFRARAGQNLVIAAQARSLIPYLADAVPGWFQATLALYDAKGDELAFVDDYRFDPDPVLFHVIAEDGEYEIEIRDAIYRGREDFVYRVAISEKPFIREMFPLGAQIGTKAAASVAGWNLAATDIALDTRSRGGAVRRAVLRTASGATNSVLYAVDTLPETVEVEPNNNRKGAERVELPVIVNGRIGEPGDVDVFRFKGRRGEEIVAEVLGRRLNSPVDSLLRLTDSRGRVLEWNDDFVDKVGHLHRGPGLVTHHADSYIRFRLPKRGVYYVHVADAQHHGGEAYAYRLRLSRPRPDFALRMTPSSLNLRAGRAVPVAVHALRQDGFSGSIDVRLIDAPEGFTLHGGRIPAGCDSIRMTLASRGQPFDEPVVLELRGRAVIMGETVERRVAPAEDSMQAFLYRHLTPSKECVAVVMGRGRGLAIQLADEGPVRIAAGGAALVRIKTPNRPMFRKLELELKDPPEGIQLRDVVAVADGMTFELEADAEAKQTTFVDNLIVEAFTYPDWGKKKGRKQRTRISLGVLPAIPYEIVRR